MVTLGHINYLNCIPVHGAILLKLVPFEGKIIEGNPAYLNRLLEMGQLTASPSSSFEIIKGYKIFKGFSISSRSSVKSIILFTKKELSKMKRGIFYITSHSQTSAMLLRLILKEFYAIEANFQSFDPSKKDLKKLIDKGDGVLYIGDYALKIGAYEEGFSYDLGELWYNFTGLPFTFALWQISKIEHNRSDILYLYDCLKKSYNFFLTNKELLAESFSDRMGFNRDFILDYWSYLSFDLTDEHIKGLNLFFKLLRKNNLIDKEPQIDIF